MHLPTADRAGVPAGRGTPPGAAPGWLRALWGTVFLLGTGYGVSLVPGLRSGAGYQPLLDGWLNNLFLAGVVALLLTRAVRATKDRAAWWCLAAGTAAKLLGSLAYYLHDRTQPDAAFPSLSDVGWVLFYPLGIAGLLTMLGPRMRRVGTGGWLDGTVTGLTAAAFAVAFALSPGVSSGHPGSSGVSYPVANILLLVVIAGALSLVGRGAGWAWWCVGGGLAAFIGVDAVYTVQAARGLYVDGGPLDLGWVLGAALLALSTTFGPAEGKRPLPGGGALLVPFLCAVAALGLLFSGYVDRRDALTGVLALGAVLAALARTARTFQQVQALADSRRQARTDELTGLPNRRRAYEALAAADVRLRQGTGVAVLLLDLDRFKEINDSLGHAAGDALLRQIAPRLGPLLRSSDVLARLGGDEFVVIATDLDATGARALAARLREQLQVPFQHRGTSLSVDASIGIAVGPQEAGTAEELLQLADLAMYAAKTGRLGIAVYDHARDGDGRHRLETAEQLRTGIGAGQLVLHHQPKVSAADGRVVGVEVLVRWQHPTRGLLLPGAFVDLAEAFGLMQALTTAVLDLAVAQCRAWRDRGWRMPVAVNVSPSNLVDQAFPRVVADLLGRHGLAATDLVLEVTEGLLMADRARAAGVLTALRGMGVGIAIDDYGTGYSSLAYLAELPVTELKLDRSFVAAMTGSPRAAAIVTSTLQLAHALGLVLVAEGVEDEPTLQALTDLGCDVVQGYELSPPVPAADLEAWLADRLAEVGPR